MAKPPDAFLSYTRFDDQYHGGAISAFREQLSMAVRAVTAKSFEIFQDVDGIGLGENWRKRLNIALGEARFFIPILTPNYFESKACRDELTTFLQFEAESRRDDLILPIYWLRCPILEDPSQRARDPLAENINDRQRSNWLKLRHKPYTDPEVREALEALAEQIGHARSRMPAVTSAERRVILKPADKKAATGLPEKKGTHQSPPASHDPQLTGRVTFNYSNNDGEYTIGQDEFLFATKWSKASDRAIHLYRNPPSVVGVAEAPELQSYRDVTDFASYDMSSRVRTINEGEHAILKNNHYKYAVLRILDVKDRTRSDIVDELTFEFWIFTEGLVQEIDAARERAKRHAEGHARERARREMTSQAEPERRPPEGDADRQAGAISGAVRAATRPPLAIKRPPLGRGPGGAVIVEGPDDETGLGVHQDRVQTKNIDVKRQAEEMRFSAGRTSPEMPPPQSPRDSRTDQSVTPDVFISYARANERQAYALAEILTKQGYVVFWDRRIPPGETWQTYIGWALTTAKCIVVIWSSHSIRSDWVLEEANEGKDRRILIPVLVEKVAPPFGFRFVQAADLIDWDLRSSSHHLQQLLDSIQKKVAGIG